MRAAGTQSAQFSVKNSNPAFHIVSCIARFLRPPSCGDACCESRAIAFSGIVAVGERTLGILAPADLDELLDIGDFGRHGEGVVWSTVGGIVVRRSS